MHAIDSMNTFDKHADYLAVQGFGSLFLLLWTGVYV